AEVNVISVSNPSGRAIGLNFVGSGTGEWGSSAILGTLAADEVAGVYPIANWNNSANEPYVFNSPAPLLLKETDGSTSAGITATWASANTWSATVYTGVPAEGDPQDAAHLPKTTYGKLLHGFTESRDAAGATVTLNNIPYATYDV